MIKDPNDLIKKLPDYTNACRKYVLQNPGHLLKQLKSFQEKKINNMKIEVIEKLK